MSKQEQKELGLREHEKKAYGFFDIDDTLTQGNTTIFFTKFLVESGFISNQTWLDVQSDLESYKHSDKGEVAYFIFATDVLNHLASSLKGKNVSSVKAIANEFLEATLRGEIEGYKILGFSKELVSIIKSFGTAVAISGSLEDVLEPIAKHLGFDQLEATTFEQLNGNFTGDVARNLAIDTEKTIVVSAYLDKVDVNKSFAFGDTTHDIPLLDSVGNKFVLGSNPILHDIGLEKGWHIHKNGEGVLEAVNEINR